MRRDAPEALCHNARIGGGRRVLPPMRLEFCEPLSAAGCCTRRVPSRCHSIFVLQTSAFRNGAHELADEPPSRASVLSHAGPGGLVAPRVLPRGSMGSLSDRPD